MVFDLEESQTGVWFEMEGGGRVQLRVPGLSDWNDIRKATVTKVPFVHEGAGKPVLLEREVVNEELQMKMQLDASIVAWDGFLDGKGNLIPCNPEMKVALMSLKDSTFRDFYNEKMAVLIEAEKGKKASSEKNLSTLQSGDPASEG